MSSRYAVAPGAGIVVRREPELVVYLAHLVSGAITVAPGVSAISVLRAIGEESPSPAEDHDRPVIDALVAAGLLVEVAP